MRYGTFAWIVMIWLFVALVGGIFDGSMSDVNSVSADGPINVDSSGTALNTVMQGDVIDMKELNLLFGTVKIPIPNGEYLKAFATLGLFNFSFWDSYNLNVARWILLVVITAPLTWMLVQLILPGIVSAIATIRQLAPGIGR